MPKVYNNQPECLAFFTAAQRRENPVVSLPFKVQSEAFAERLKPDKTISFLAFNAATQEQFKSTAAEVERY